MTVRGKTVVQKTKIFNSSKRIACFSNSRAIIKRWAGLKGSEKDLKRMGRFDEFFLVENKNQG